MELQSSQNQAKIYRKNPKISDTWKFIVITLKVEQGAVWSWSALFAQTCLSENLGTLQ